MCFIILLSVFAIVYFVPVICGIIVSFTDWNGMSSEFSFIGFENYVKMFSDSRFRNAVWITTQYALILLLFSILFGYVIARTIKESQKAKSAMLFIAFFPYVITPVIVCVLWNQLFINLIPIMGKALNIDILKTNLLANKSTAIWAVAFVDLWMLVPYAMLLILSSLTSIPTDLIEYAKLEKANRWKIFRYIELPYLLPTFGMISTIIISYALTHIDTIMTLTAGGPGRSTETLYYIVYKNSTLEQRYAYGLAEGMVVSAISMFVFIIISKFTNSKNAEGVFYGGEQK